MVNHMEFWDFTLLAEKLGGMYKNRERLQVTRKGERVFLQVVFIEEMAALLRSTQI